MAAPHTPSSDARSARLRAFVLVGMVALVIVSAAVAWARYQPAQPIEIRLPEQPSLSGDIQIGGAVANPGVYPFSGTDTIGSLLQGAGGTTGGAATGALQLTIPQTGAQTAPQKININRAEAWLLEALPGIGATRAKTIIAYRQQNGPFKHTSELMKVEGIGQAVYDQIRDLITVSE